MQYEFRGRKVKVNLNLNDEQIAAMEEIVDFIQSDRTCLTLMGYAGTGGASVFYRTTDSGFLWKDISFGKSKGR